MAQLARHDRTVRPSRNQQHRPQRATDHGSHPRCHRRHGVARAPRPTESSLAAYRGQSPLLYSVTSDFAFIPGPWRASSGTPPELGVPTSYYATVQFTCDSEIIDDPQAKADLLGSQLRHLQPDGDHAEVDIEAEPYGRLLPGIRGLRLTIIEVIAKFKYDDHKPIEHRSRVSQLLVQRGRLQDAGAARQQTRRLAERGEWKQP